ncbi:MAG: 23S rRNA (pseudouridine(1915)-N(3))-methyltransferase RlmH [Erysipelotrichales bacterium]
MKVNIVCVGRIKEKYLVDGIEEFIKRLKPYCKLSIEEVVETRINDNPSEADIENVVNDEGEKLLSHIKKQDFVIALDVAGKNINNHEYVRVVEKAMLNGYSSFVFVIGGSHGISKAVLERANFKWSFSSLVFTHQMIRLLLLEQIYRGYKIMNNEPYHK